MSMINREGDYICKKRQCNAECFVEVRGDWAMPYADVSLFVAKAY